MSTFQRYAKSMPTLKVMLNQETIDALQERAQQELRPPDYEAAALLRQSLGLPLPSEPRRAANDTDASKVEIAEEA